MNSEEMKQFMSDYNDLKAKYPMVAFDAWTPIDFAYIIADERGEDEPKDIDWDDDIHHHIANTLMIRYCAESGYNNDLVRETIVEIIEEVKP